MQHQLPRDLVISKDNFPDIRSVPNWYLTWFIRLTLCGVLLMCMILFFIIPILLYQDGKFGSNQLISFGILYYPLLIWISVLSVRYLKRIRGNAIRHLTVNREGIFYEKFNGEIESIQYKQLECANEAVDFDVFSKMGGRHSPTRLYIFIDRGKKIMNFHTDAGYSYYAGNNATLRSHFIHGIKLFRPDLRIAESVYSEFYINPETHTFDKSRYRKNTIIAAIVIILFFLCIEWYMVSRFGRGVFFGS